jgi:hypothetical protein
MRPSSFYMRKEVQDAGSLEQCKKTALYVIFEYEELRAWIRQKGLIPPKERMLDSEAKAKGLIGQADSELLCSDCGDCTKSDTL